MKRSFFLFSLTLLGIFAHPCLSAAENNVQSSFTPHKALYDITLESVKSGAQITGISGQMLYEWAEDCEAWTSSHRFNLLYEYADSPTMRITSDFSTFETFDGNTLSFSAQRKQNGKLYKDIRGQAVLDPKTNTGQVEYAMPKELRYDLPQGTAFPMAHSLAILQHIHQGKQFYNTTVFDGSDDEGPVEVNAFIGKSATLSPVLYSASNIQHDLLKSPAHHIQLAFFPIAQPSESADYEMNLTLLENSVITEMQIKYSDFTIRQTLIALEHIPKTCENQRTETSE